jgi:hypothetical protein
MEANMRIIARGWGRNQGETEIMNVALGDAVDPPAPGDYYSSGQAYLEVEHPYLRKRTTAKVSAGTEQLRLGGRYLLKIELSRDEIAKLFYATHGGDIVRTFRQFLEDEERQEEEEEQRQEAARLAASIQHHQHIRAQREKRELLKQVGEKLASLKQQQE